VACVSRHYIVGLYRVVTTIYLFLVLVSNIETPSSLAVDDQQKASDELRKDVSELGIEVIDQISAAAGNTYTGE